VIEPISLSETVTLRMVRHTDAGPLAAAYTKNRGHLAPWEPTRTDAFFTTTWQAIEIPRWIAGYHAGTTLPLVLVTETATGTQIVGKITLSGIARGAAQSASMGYWVDADQTGTGLGSAAVAAVTTLARRDLDLHRIEAGTLVHNVASQRVLAKAGFDFIGLAPRYLQIAGRWQDHNLFQLILHNNPHRDA
jgi:ribosomal-protein-alanine N-acetyltransferase